MSVPFARWSVSVLVTALALAAASCDGGEKLFPVTGALRVNGKPAGRALLMLHPEPPTSPHDAPATATTAEDGTFSFSTGARPGAKPGKYVVTIVWPDPNKVLTDAQKMMGVSPYDAPDALAGRYATRDKSPLRAEVRAEATALQTFELTK